MNIEPRILRGFRDYLPAQMIVRQKMISTIRGVYERYGFVPLDTPAMELLEVLTGEYGEESEMNIFQFRGPDENMVCLRFDLTVPLSRVVAMYPELPRPFKRYHVAPVWRKDKPQAGRFREFIQFDADIVGTSSMLADTEIICLIYDTMFALGLRRFLIKVNNRKVLNALIEFAGIDPFFANDVLRILDKLEKISLEGVKEELMKKGDPNVDQKTLPSSLRCLGLDEPTVDKLVRFISIQGSSDDILAQLEEYFRDFIPAQVGIAELKEIVANLNVIGIPKDNYRIDLSIARGLEYYTGPVYETTLLDLPGFGNVFSGGRFDKLIGRFQKEDIPATGASIGVDRLFAAMEELGMIDLYPSTAQILVTIFDRSRLADYQLITRELRQAGFPTELYMGENTSLGRQLQYADRQKIPLVIIIGSEEFEQNSVSVKDLRKTLGDTTKQKTVKREELVGYITSLLKSGG